MKRINIAILIIIVCPLVTFAESEGFNNVESQKEKKEINPILYVGLVEGVFVLNALMASEVPQVYGVLAALLFPIASAELDNPITFWVGLAAAESLAIYNITLDKDKDSQSEIFRNNMIGWHVFAGIVGLTAWLSNNSQDTEEHRLSAAIIPTPKGAELKFEYRF